LTTFPDPGTTRVGPEKANMITGPGWPGFAPETYAHYLGCTSSRLSLVLLKTVLVEFRRLFRTRALLKQVKWKIGPIWLSLHSKHTHIVCGDIHIVFSQYGWKLFQPSFDDFSRPGYHNSLQSWKLGPEDSISLRKHTYTLWGAILIISHQYDQKMFQPSFDDFSGPVTTGAGKVENRPHMTLFSA